MNLIRLFAQVKIDTGDIENVPNPGVDLQNANNDTITDVLSIVFGVAGGVALIVIVVAGVMFILSRGEPQKAATARATIIYAAVGLAIAVSAFSIVRLMVSLL